MKRGLLISCILVTIVAFSCCSCGLVGEQRFSCNIEEVKSVQIVRLDEYIEGQYRYDYTVLAEISNCETFVSDLNGLDYSVNWGDPRPMQTQYVVIKINYNNGDFDLIHSNAQWFNRDGKNRNGYFFFDEEQFDKLISKYQSGDDRVSQSGSIRGGQSVSQSGVNQGTVL